MVQFQRNHKVRFSQTDYAGIMFYPRYFEMLNAVVEDWFDEALGVSFSTLLDKHQLGSPLAGIDTQFMLPCRLGEILNFELDVKRVGASSVTLDVIARCGSESRMQSTLTHVCVSRDISKAVPWPDDIRHRMLECLEERN